jgi:hypothetical protein
MVPSYGLIATSGYIVKEPRDFPGLANLASDFRLTQLYTIHKYTEQELPASLGLGGHMDRRSTPRPLMIGNPTQHSPKIPKGGKVCILKIPLLKIPLLKIPLLKIPLLKIPLLKNTKGGKSVS